MFFVSSLAYDRSRGILFYTTDNDDWRDLNQVDIKTGRTRLLLKDARIGDLVFNAADRSLWGVRHFNGISTLVRIPSPYREWNQIYSWPYGKDIYDIDISPDGRSLVAALTEINGRQSLILMDTSKLLGGDAGFEALSDFENSSPANFVFAEDGNTLYGSSYYSGVSNIYRCDLKTKEIRILSNCDTGLFKPLPLSPDSLLAFRYTSTGLLPVIIPSQLEPKASSIVFLGTEIVNKYPVLKSWEAPPPSSVDINKLIVAQGRYALLSHLGLRSLYPIVEGYKESLAYGLRLDLSDPVGLNNLDLTLSYSPDTSLKNSEKVHLKLNLAFSDWKISLSHNNADFYDIFGSSKTNTKTSFKGEALELLYRKSLIFDEPNRTMDYSVLLAGYFNLERLPDYQNVLASFNRLFSLTLNYNYKYQRASLGAVDYEQGFQWQSYLSSSYVNERLYPRLYTNLDLGFPLPLRHSSIWLRSSFGRSFANRQNPLDPFPNFYFGGFGNTWIDHLAQRRYRNFYSFPGVDINSVGGWNYAKALLEWNLPPLVFKRLGFPFFYANWASLSLFSSALATNVNGTGDRQLLDLGGQLDIRLIALSNYQFTLSLGYAWAWEKEQPRTTEWMVSLKIH